MSKNLLINEINRLLDPRPKFIVFRSTDFTPDSQKKAINKESYNYNGNVLTRQECEAIPTRMHIFVNRGLRK
jgi:hypothetical protein